MMMSVLVPTPEHMSLLQAAIWLVQGRRPVADEIFAGAPLILQLDETSSDGPLRDLLFALRAGLIQTRAGLALRLLLDSGEVVVGIPGRPSYPVEPTDWYFERVVWNESRLNFETEDFGSEWLERRIPRPVRKDVQAKSRLSSLIREEHCTVAYQPILLNRDDLTANFPRLASSPAPAPKEEHVHSTRTLVGRPRKHDWDAFFVELAAFVYTNGLPHTQAMLVERMAEWCQAEWGMENVPASSQLKSKIAPLFRRLGLTPNK
jgi:hypothetical protein